MIKRIRTAIRVAWRIIKGDRQRIGIITSIDGEKGGDGRWKMTLEADELQHKEILIACGTACGTDGHIIESIDVFKGTTLYCVREDK